MSVKYIDNTNAVKARIKHGAGVFVRMAAEDVLRKAYSKTPRKDGNLRADTTVAVQGNKAIIVWHKQYAQYQERGMRRDGTHVVRNYTTAGTGKKFAENAVKEVVKETGSYVLKAMRVS